RTGTHVDPNQEMVGLGVANLAAGFFQGFPISFVTYPRGGSCRGPNAVDWRRRRSRCCSAAVGSAKSTSASTRYRFVRSNGPNPNFSHSTLGVLAIYSLLGGCSRLWCYPRHRLGHRNRYEFCDTLCVADINPEAIEARCHRIPVGWLASAR